MAQSKNFRQCESSCICHRGNARYVHIVDQWNNRDLGYFWFCEDAIVFNIRTGYTVIDGATKKELHFDRIQEWPHYVVKEATEFKFYC